jgi:hypothetical protein
LNFIVMAITADQLRKALRELNGERKLGLVFADVHSPAHVVSSIEVKNAMLVPDEADHLVKVTDGRSIYIIDAERVAWLSIS